MPTSGLTCYPPPPPPQKIKSQKRRNPKATFSPLFGAGANRSVCVFLTFVDGGQKPLNGGI